MGIKRRISKKQEEAMKASTGFVDVMSVVLKTIPDDIPAEDRLIIAMNITGSMMKAIIQEFSKDDRAE